MHKTKRYIVISAMIQFAACSLQAQEAFVEVSGKVSSGNFAPLWLSSNRQGVVSPYANSAYERIGYQHDFYFGKPNENHEGTEDKDWHIQAAADIMLSQNAQQKFSIHQLYGEISYKKVSLTIGQKERQIDLRNNSLTSGGLSQGINAQPIPEVLGSVDYFSIPFCNHWWKWRGRIGYGKTTDGNWQKNWVADINSNRYTSNYLYCERMIGWKIGDEERFPLVFEPSLQMMTQFGGTTYNVAGRNHDDASVPIVHAENFNAFWHAFWPMGSNDETDGNMPNSAGNTLGSYNFAVSWITDTWKIRGYFERIFEDQSMLTVQYGIFDHLAGIDIDLPENPYVTSILVEHMSTKDQAGPVYHDKSPNIPESYTGIDNYYNHHLYPGWQNYGMTIGNPLLTSPIYNSNHDLHFYNNRVRALHIGVNGQPNDWLSWGVIATFTRNWGTYAQPYDDVRNQQYFLTEISILPRHIPDWQFTFGIGYDHGDLENIGNSVGAQLTIRKTFNFRKGQ